jgi:hypothetical protein
MLALLQTVTVHTLCVTSPHKQKLHTVYLPQYRCATPHGPPQTAHCQHTQQSQCYSSHTSLLSAADWHSLARWKEQSHTGDSRPTGYTGMTSLHTLPHPADQQLFLPPTCSYPVWATGTDGTVPSHLMLPYRYVDC